MIIQKTIATVFGIGYIQKGAGTIAAIIYCLLWYLSPAVGLIATVTAILAVTVLGIWSGNHVEKQWGKDSNRVVIDEFAGMMITLINTPVQIKYLITGLLLFRFFDIVKPLGIRKLELIKGGWGVMADDVLAGIYALIVLQIIVYTEII